MKKVKNAEELLVNIEIEEFKKYYFTHSDNDIIERFQLSVTYLKRITDYLDIHKTAEQRKQIQINTNIQKYGCAVPTQNKEIASKISNALKGNSHKGYWESYLNRFDNPEEAIYQRNIKTKHTKQDKYGDENYNNRDKYKETCLDKYGVDCYCKTNDFIDKRKSTYQQNYGVDSPAKAEAVRKKMQNTCFERYGVTHNWASKDKKLNGRATMLRKYGDEQPLRLKQFIQKISKARKCVASDGTELDSHYELYVYEWCLRNNKKVERNIPIKYQFNGSNHTTFIDFKIDDKLYEVKGGHLLSGIYDYVGVPIAVKLDIYKENDVTVITDENFVNRFENVKTMSICRFKDSYNL